MAKRKIIRIDEKKCNGCALCIPDCPEGAILIIDNKARLISDLFCDGLGACLGHCPQGAITIEEREAQPYDEDKVMANIIKQGPNVIKAHLLHLQEHKEFVYLKQATDFLKKKKINISFDPICNRTGTTAGACPGTRVVDLRKPQAAKSSAIGRHQESELGQWPIQLRLVPAFAPYFDGADILITADCVPFAFANFHEDLYIRGQKTAPLVVRMNNGRSVFRSGKPRALARGASLKGRILLVGCPKLDDLSLYAEKLKQIFADNNIKSVTYAHMEVPCCFGLLPVIEEALRLSGKGIPLEEEIISIKGEKIK